MVRIAWRLALVSFLSGLFGGTPAAEPPTGHVNSEEGFVDIDLTITDAREGPAGVVSIVARGAIHGNMGIAPAPQAMSPEVEVAAVGLNSDPTQVLKTPTKMKFFFEESEPEDLYAEVFTNIDVRGKRLQFHEKDPEYRESLVKALGEGT